MAKFRNDAAGLKKLGEDERPAGLLETMETNRVEDLLATVLLEVAPEIQPLIVAR